jgi:iron complex outermembrane receptor protein
LAALLAVTISSGAAARSGFGLDGVVLAPTGDPVTGAWVAVDGREPVVTDENGRFSIVVEPGEWELEVTHPAYQAMRYPVTVGDESQELVIRFEAAAAVEETITVIGIRAGDEVPVTKRNMDREEIETLSYGQDAPALLQYTPAMTWYSDSGIGSNYSYFSMRGIQQTRINMTFDGAPLNDPAEHAVYFNNFHDFSNTVDSIQIQRGVGTSSVGSPSYGGSVNFASGPPSPTRGGDLRLVLGSYDIRSRQIFLCGHRRLSGQLRNQTEHSLLQHRLAGRAVVSEAGVVLWQRRNPAGLSRRRSRDPERESALQSARRGRAR